VQVTFRPLQILSRVVAVCMVALPLAALSVALDGYEREIIGKMSHQELIAFVEEGHASSFLGAYFLSMVTTLIVVVAVEAVAFGIRFAVGLFGAKRPAYVSEEEFDPARADAFH
jgi:hypothetical protein